jgi:hypothetical protein
VKPPEVLTRDRLLATYEVRPTLAKLRSTLLGMGGILLVTAVLLFGLIRAGTDEDGVYGRGARPVPRQVTAGGAGFLLGYPAVHWVKSLQEAAAASKVLSTSRLRGFCLSSAWG